MFFTLAFLLVGLKMSNCTVEQTCCPSAGENSLLRAVKRHFREVHFSHIGDFRVECFAYKMPHSMSHAVSGDQQHIDTQLKSYPILDLYIE